MTRSIRSLVLLAALAAAAVGRPAPADAADTGGNGPDPQVFKDILDCMADGLPKDWQKAWVVVTWIERNVFSKERTYEAKFRYATSLRDSTGEPLAPCKGHEVSDAVVTLNQYLKPEQRNWTSATFTFLRDGHYDVKYDYSVREAPENPAAEPSSKKQKK